MVRSIKHLKPKIHPRGEPLSSSTERLHTDVEFELEEHSNDSDAKQEKRMYDDFNATNVKNRRPHLPIALKPLRNSDTTGDVTKTTAGDDSKWGQYNSLKREPSSRLSNIHANLHPKDSRNEKKRYHEMLNKNMYGIHEEAVENEMGSQASTKKQCSSAGDKALIIYFAKLSDTTDVDAPLDLDFIENLVENGADVNFTDKFGQTVMHEAARAWHIDVAEFLIQQGATSNAVDQYGRTPLHVAAAVNYPEMVDFLIKNGANISGETFGEQQTPLHYAAKNDAVEAVKLLVQLGAVIDAKDYKERTSLQLACELDRSLAAKLLIELGALIGVCDSSGVPATTLMIENMCAVAKEALDKLHVLNGAHRKQSYYLNLLEPETLDVSARSPMRVMVKQRQMELVTLPVFKRLLQLKWNKFGRRRHFVQLFLYCFYILLWTAIAILLPKTTEGGKKKTTDTIKKEFLVWWRLSLDGIALLLTLYYIILELTRWRAHVRDFRRYKKWRMNDLHRDLAFTHPQWPDERAFLGMKIRFMKQSKERYYTDLWNVFDWLTFILALGVMIAHSFHFWKYDDAGRTMSYHRKLLSVTIIFIWVRLMKYIRVFSALGPFIVMLGHIMDATLKFAFLFFEIYIPFVISFWILFGGPENSLIMNGKGKSSEGWNDFHDLMFSVWQLVYGGNFNYAAIHEVDGIWAEIMVGMYVASSTILLLNLFIALMSNSFQTVYDNAKANALMQKALVLLSHEDARGGKKNRKFQSFLHTDCAPLMEYYDDDMDEVGGREMEKITLQIKSVVDDIQDNIGKLSEQNDAVRHRGSTINPESTAHAQLQTELAKLSKEHHKATKSLGDKMENLQEEMSRHVGDLRVVMAELAEKQSQLMMGFERAGQQKIEEAEQQKKLVKGLTTAALSDASRGRENKKEKSRRSEEGSERSRSETMRELRPLKGGDYDRRGRRGSQQSRRSEEGSERRQRSQTVHEERRVVDDDDDDGRRRPKSEQRRVSDDGKQRPKLTRRHTEAVMKTKSREKKRTKGWDESA